MRSAFADEVERLVAACGLTLTAEALYSAPRDVASPPSEMEQHHLVTLVRRSGEGSPLRVVFITPLTESAPPTLRDVLWWLAGDAWAVERSGATLGRWAAIHGYPLEEPASAQLFARHVTQASALKAWLGADAYRSLLAAYATQVGAGEQGDSSR